MPAGQSNVRGRRHGLEPARHPDPLTREAVVQTTGRPTTCPRLDPPATEAQVDAQRAVEVAGIAHERGHTRPRARRRGPQAGPRARRATRCEQRGADAEHDRRATGERGASTTSAAGSGTGTDTSAPATVDSARTTAAASLTP